MSRGDWLRRHRKGVLVAGTLLLGLFLPLPGLLVAWLIWPAGVHDLDGTAAGAAAFFACIFLGSAVVWAMLLNLFLPRPR